MLEAPRMPCNALRVRRHEASERQVHHALGKRETHCHASLYENRFAYEFTGDNAQSKDAKRRSCNAHHRDGDPLHKAMMNLTIGASQRAELPSHRALVAPLSNSIIRSSNATHDTSACRHQGGKIVSCLWKNCRKDVALSFGFYTNTRN